MARNSAVVESFAELVREKRMDRDILQSIIEDTFSMLMRKKYGLDANFDIVLNMDKGEIEIYLIKAVVADDAVENPSTQIAVTAANKKGAEKLDVGDEHVEVIDNDLLSAEFGRRMVITARQNLNQRIRDVEKETIYNEYSGQIGEIIVGEVYQIRRGDVYVLHNRAELRMPRMEQIPRERYKKGDTIRAVIKEVQRNLTGTPEVIISRADGLFMQRLFENEIPEIYDGIIEIKGIAREPGERAKGAVVSHDDRVDPVGACVGMKGVRIHSIVRELCNENIDMIPYSPDQATFLARSLSPAKPKEVTLDPVNKRAVVLLDTDQVALAVGRGGQNVRLASKLTGYKIDLIKEGGEDIELSEFEEEFGFEIVDLLYAAGFKTAKQVLDADEEDLMSIEGLSREKLTEIRDIMRKEFEEDEEIFIGEEPLTSVVAVKPAAAAVPVEEVEAENDEEEEEDAVETAEEGDDDDMEKDLDEEDEDEVEEDEVVELENQTESLDQEIDEEEQPEKSPESK